MVVYGHLAVQCRRGILLYGLRNQDVADAGALLCA